MMLSKSCENAIRAAVLLTQKTRHAKKRFVPVQELAGELDMSFHFLAKILQRLTEAGILESFRGPNGGVALHKSPEQINLVEIITAIDGSELFDGCVLGLPQCNDSAPCPMHRQWKKQREALHTMFRRANLSDLARDTRQIHLK